MRVVSVKERDCKSKNVEVERFSKLLFAWCLCNTMNVDRDARMAALRRNQKENFVGADVKKARRISEMRERQKEKRRSVWNQGREGLDLCEEDEENAAQAKAG